MKTTFVLRALALRGSLASLLLSAAVGAPAEAQEIWDPLEPVNRAIFSFNDTVDEYVLEPVARGYNDVMPDRAKLGVKNFFNNLGYPVYLVSDVLQLKFTQAAHHTGRFLINTTVGVGGLMDIAKKHGLPPHEEDTGSAFGYWGVPPGPYIVLPLLGPSNARDAVGRVGDSFLNPVYYVGEPGVAISLTALEVIDRRRRLLDALQTGKESSLDYYTFIQSPYMQHRPNVIYDGEPPPEIAGEAADQGDTFADPADENASEMNASGETK